MLRGSVHPGISALSGVELRPGLPRRVFFGVRLADDEGHGAQVLEVHAESTAASVGVRIGDRIVRLEGEPVTGGAHCQGLIRRLRSAQRIEVEVVRSGGRERLSGLVRPWPTEHFTGSPLILDQIGPPGRRQRVFLTRPDAPGPHPAVMMMRGFSCRSCEFPLHPEVPLRLLLDAWSRAGYCTLRVEKPGVGDSEGPPCRDVGFCAELAGARAGLGMLRSADFVDSRRIALFGHSVGGMIAPLLAAESPVAGIGTFGSSADRFSDCVCASRRRQLALAGESLELLPAMRELQELLIRETLSPGEALDRRPDLVHALPFISTGGRLFGRSLVYARELDRADIEGAWTRLDAEVAVFHAEYDYVCSREEALRIVELVNQRGCGRARLIELAGVGHLLYKQASLRASFAEPLVGIAKSGIVPATLQWLARAVGPGRGPRL